MATANDLIGGYTVTGGEKFGRPIPQERIYGTTVKFTGDTVTVTDAKDQEQYAATYQVDTAATPWRIAMTATNAPNAGEVALGLVDKSGDTVRLIYALPGGEAPQSFTTRDRQLLFVMQNFNKK